MASGQGSSLKLAAAVKLLADYLFVTNEKVSALEYYKEALARVEARTEHDRAKPQTQSFSAQVCTLFVFFVSFSGSFCSLYIVPLATVCVCIVGLIVVWYGRKRAMGSAGAHLGWWQMTACSQLFS